MYLCFAAIKGTRHLISKDMINLVQDNNENNYDNNKNKKISNMDKTFLTNGGFQVDAVGGWTYNEGIN